jgi:death-on-curing protein
MSDHGEPAFLTLGQVMRIHRLSLAAHGGLDGVRDAGAIESALASAQNAWFYAEGDTWDIAAAYAFHIAESQAFLDGNKRTAIASAVAFLTANGCFDHATDDDLYDAMIAIAERRMDKTGLAAVLRRQFPRTA